MNYSSLGNTNLEISEIGFGCWPMGKFGWGNVSDQESITAVHRALDVGINFFDTADIYGLGHAEKILAKALGSKRKNVIISTKFGIRRGKEKTFRDCSPEWIIAAVEGSLNRLKIDCIPLYHIHWPDPETPLHLTIEALKQLQQSGKIQYIACSNFSLEQLEFLGETGLLKSIQASYNLLDRRIEDGIVPYCIKSNLSITTYSSLAQGLLTGKYKVDNSISFSDQDIRKRSLYFSPAIMPHGLRIVELIQKISRKYNKTVGQVALRWLVDKSYITSAIIGMKTSDQVNENAGVSGWSLEEADSNALSQLSDSLIDQAKMNPSPTHSN